MKQFLNNNIDSLEASEKEHVLDLLKRCGDPKKSVAIQAQEEFAAAINGPVKEGVFNGDNVSNIFEQEVFPSGAAIEYPVDPVSQDDVDEFTAFAIPNQGQIPEKTISGDEVHVPTYQVGNAVDMSLRYARDARFPIMQKALNILTGGFIRKNNDDGWAVLLAAGVANASVANDADADAGVFTKALISQMKLNMRRASGGNAQSVDRGKLTHLFLSPEAMEDIRNWGVDQIDEISRREIYLADDGTASKIFGVTLVELDELGVGQPYQTYYTSTLSGTMASGDQEIVVGLDLESNDSFVNPVREELSIHEDEALHRKGKVGFYGRGEWGWGVLDTRRVAIGSL